MLDSSQNDAAELLRSLFSAFGRTLTRFPARVQKPLLLLQTRRILRLVRGTLLIGAREPLSMFAIA
jgi:hypothetical protein